MATRRFADLSSYRRAVDNAQGTANLLDSVLGGIQQGVQLQRLPQTLQQQDLANQLQNAINQEKLRRLQNPQAAMAEDIASKLTLEAALNPNSGLLTLQPGLGTIATPGAITQAQEAALPSTLTPQTVLPTAAAGIPVTEVAPFGIGTGVYSDPSIPLAAAEREAALKRQADLQKVQSFAPGTTVGTIDQVLKGQGVKIPDKSSTQRSLEFRDDGVAIIGLDPFTGKEVSRTPKVSGVEYRTSPAGLFRLTRDETGRAVEELVEGSGPVNQGGLGVYTSEQRSAVNQLSDRFQRNPYVKKAEAAQGALDIILKGLDNSNSAGDIAAINQFQSGMVDPGATVREGDVELIRRSAALSQRLTNLLPRLVKGGVLPPELRKEIKEMSSSIYEMRAKNANEIEASRVKQLAPKFGITFEDVAREFPTLAQMKGEKVQAAPEGTILMISASGDEVYVPSQNVNEAIRRGAKRK